ncbi:TPA: DMT family transporter [Methanosarcinaceae archaeon]|nr:DMT family transporter [Methanosarcinaceae archaeon]
MFTRAGSFKSQSEVIGGSIIYGTLGIFLDRIQDMSVGSILFCRLFFGLCMLFLYLFLSGGLEELRLGRNRKYLLLLGFLNTVTGLCFFSAIRYSGISVAILLLYTAPVYVSLLAPTILGEKRNGKSLLPLALAVAGVLLIARPGEGLSNFGADSSFFKGLLFGMLSGLSFGAVIITVRYIKDDYSGMAQTFWLTGVSLVPVLPSIASTPFPLVLENLQTLVLFGVTITLAALIYLKGIAGISAQTGSILALIEPVSGIFFDVTVLKSPLYINTVLGCCFILMAAYLAGRSREGEGNLEELLP